ncbi:MAG: hypothetical protein ABIO05_06845 [Ferruginibacter sp.]
MAINLLDKTVAALGYTPLKKIDPNTENVKHKGIRNSKEVLSQSVIPAVLAAISHLSKSDEGIATITSGNQQNWSSALFGTHREQVIGNIAGYAMNDYAAAEAEVNNVASKAITIINEHITDCSNNNKQLKDFIKNQRDNILPYLPGQLHLGNLLDNSTIDDNTNKMAGPVSSLMHKIQASFGGNETAEDATKKENEI